MRIFWLLVVLLLTAFAGFIVSRLATWPILAEEAVAAAFVTLTATMTCLALRRAWLGMHLDYGILFIATVGYPAPVLIYVFSFRPISAIEIGFLAFVVTLGMLNAIALLQVQHNAIQRFTP